MNDRNVLVRRYRSCIHLLGLAMAAASAAEVAAPLETWTTRFECGGQTYVVDSHCRRSNKPFELNQCVGGQSMSAESARTLLPGAESKRGANSLFAVGWSCTQAHGQRYITLSYASGKGLGEEDELSEVFDLSLHLVVDKSLQAEVFRNEGNVTHGRIRSILPDGDVNK